jgi:hypothetical protein
MIADQYDPIHLFELVKRSVFGDCFCKGGLIPLRAEQFAPPGLPRFLELGLEPVSSVPLLVPLGK